VNHFENQLVELMAIVKGLHGELLIEGIPNCRDKIIPEIPRANTLSLLTLFQKLNHLGKSLRQILRKSPLRLGIGLKECIVLPLLEKPGQLGQMAEILNNGISVTGKAHINKTTTLLRFHALSNWAV
jgi:hypothetical protein